MRNILILGASGSVARYAIDLFVKTDAVTPYARKARQTVVAALNESGRPSDGVT